MAYSLALVTGPASEPVTLSEAKAHLKVEHSDDDTLITSLIKAARGYCETYTRRAFITQTWDLFMDEFPPSSDEPIFIHNPKLQSVTHVKYFDINNVEQTWAGANYQVDIATEPGRILPVDGTTWPAVKRRMNAVNVRYVAGYGAASDVPQEIKQAMLLLIGDWYENREDSSLTNSGASSHAIKSLLYSKRVLVF